MNNKILINKNDKIRIVFRLNNYFNECNLFLLKNKNNDLFFRIDNFFKILLLCEEDSFFIRNSLVQGKMFELCIFFNDNINIEINDNFKCCINSLNFDFNDVEFIELFNELEENGIEIFKFEVIK